jgi:hypothetical protein
MIVTSVLRTELAYACHVHPSRLYGRIGLPRRQLHFLETRQRVKVAQGMIQTSISFIFCFNLLNFHPCLLSHI